MKIRLDKWLKREFDPPPAIRTTQGRGAIPCWARWKRPLEYRQPTHD